MDVYATCSLFFTYTFKVRNGTYFMPSIMSSLSFFSLKTYIDFSCYFDTFSPYISPQLFVPFYTTYYPTSFKVNWKSTPSPALTAPMPEGKGSTILYNHASDTTNTTLTVVGYGQPNFPAFGEPTLYFQLGLNQFIDASKVVVDPTSPNCFQKAKDVVCRSKKDLCDIEEICDGLSYACPVDKFNTTAGIICRASTHSCEENSFCMDGGCPSKNALKAQGTICDATSMKVCSENGTCTADTDENYCTFLTSDVCVKRNDLCKWCRSLGSCIKKTTACPDCISFSKSECALGGSCSWCSATSICTSNSGSNEAKCPQCEDRDQTDCALSEGCKWCSSKKTCLKKELSCPTCQSISYSSDCKLLPGCKSCYYSNYYFSCILEEDRCNDCSSFDSSKAQCNATSTSFSPRELCTWCGDLEETSLRCLEKGVECSYCAEYTRDACASDIECVWCPRKASCVSQALSKNITCSCGDSLPSEQTCNTYKGCSFCQSSQKCENSVMYNPSISENYGTCYSCSDIPFSACTSYPGCKRCRGKCMSSKENCLNCAAKLQGNCKTEDNCKWCASSKICTSIFSFTEDCAECSSFAQKYCGVQLSQGCTWCQKIGGCTSSCPSESSQSYAAVIAGIVVGSFVFVCISVFVALLLLKNRNEKTASEIASRKNTLLATTFEKTKQDIELEFSSILKPDVVLEAELVSFKKSFLSIDPSHEIKCNFGNQIPIGVQHKEEFSLKNISSQTLNVEIYCPKSHKEHSFTTSPTNFTLSPGESKELKVSICFFVTKLAKALLYVQANDHYSEIELEIESEQSSMVSYSEIIKEKVIGEGGYGIVYKGKYRGLTVAIKEIKGWGITDSGLVEEIHREVDLMQRMRSLYVVTFIGSVITQQTMCIVMEFCEKGCLSNLLHSGEALKPSFKSKVVLDAAMGMNFLHQNNIMHRDFKPDNLLVVSTNPSSICVKITDFGTSRLAIDDGSQNYTKGVGTPVYMAPELLDGNQYSFPSDVYSFAIVAWEIWHQQKPYSQLETTMAIIAFLQSGKRIEISQDCPFKGVIENCWQASPAKRPEFSEIIPTLTKSNSQMEQTFVQTFQSNNTHQNNPKPKEIEMAPVVQKPTIQKPQHKPNIPGNSNLNSNSNPSPRVPPRPQPNIPNKNTNLPSGWIAATDESGDVYYVNVATKETQWEKPDLPAGWISAKDDAGDTYYVHRPTNKTQWEKPV